MVPDIGVPMRRREFITLLGSTATWPLVARAQQAERMRRIGVISGTSEIEPTLQSRLAVFRDALEKLGWAAGRNVVFDYRFGTADLGRIEADAANLVALAPDVILVQGTASLDALRKLTLSLPL